MMKRRMEWQKINDGKKYGRLHLVRMIVRQRKNTKKNDGKTKKKDGKRMEWQK